MHHTCRMNDAVQKSPQTATAPRHLANAAPRLPGRRWAKVLLTARRLWPGGRAEVLIALLALASAIATYVAMSRESAPFEVTEGKTIRYLLTLNGILLIGLAALIARWFVRFWMARRTGAPGSRLHTRVTGAFIVIAMVPPIIMAVFSALFLEFGIQTWFSEKVRTTLNNSLEVAEAYIAEHRATIGKDVVAISIAFNNLDALQQNDPATLQRVADTALGTRLLTEILVVEERDGEGRVLARANDSLGLRTSRFPSNLITRAHQGETVVTSNIADNTVLAIVRLQSFFTPTYLYITRDLNPQVLGYLDATRTAVRDYNSLEDRRVGLQLQFNVVFIIVALLILLAAIWIGLWFSGRLVTPLSNLVDAAERVGRGDLDVRVPSVPSSDEVGTLSRAFNRMTDQLARHQDALMDANMELDERRRFLEEVLENVSAGIIGLHEDGRVFLPNPSACRLLGRTHRELMNVRLGEKVPEFADLLDRAREAEDGSAQAQIHVEVAGENRTLLVRTAADRKDSGIIEGYVVTFDDLTDQLADQRTAAWADVARRIAHEIKNPLTPIQLSAERLRRKYLKEVTSDPRVFSQCTDTIIRQVGDLRRLVNEFSAFARMPAPLLKETDIVDVVRQAVFLQDVALGDIRFETDLPEEPTFVYCDGRLIGQALTNLLKNAAESVETRCTRDSGTETDTPAGHIRITLQQEGAITRIIVEDNGTGLPKDQKDRLMEPYVTTRDKGTGLGLAIVKRILEEHSGSVRLADRASGGARAIVAFSHKVLARRAQAMAALGGQVEATGSDTRERASAHDVRAEKQPKEEVCDQGDTPRQTSAAE
ncbi:two-component system nitrogen regulation sensor histidine kinase NtrY [Eilatimonas milleporae]|uniref:histidine kinase n=2 Tax=Eilatimonas milleporae TaxID=911205 RepID=A0A3M0CK81_9PROT|nr:two-component system nitrogen regulation sensor histidine kinase NtrY [Eilatimonas milleporae]